MQIPVPLEKEFTIPWGEDSFTITFRQATGADDDRLLSYERQVKVGHWVDQADGSRYYHSEVWEPEKVAAEKVRLALVSCSLEKDGKPLFVAGMERKPFNAAWGLLPSNIRNEMHQHCIEVNPDWDPFWYMNAEKNSEPRSKES